MGKVCFLNSLSGRPCMRERPESLWYSASSRVKIHEDWVIRRKPARAVCESGLLRDYTGRDCDVQDIVQPANPRILRAVRESLMLEAKQRAAGSSPAGGTYPRSLMAGLVKLVRSPCLCLRGRRC